MYREQIVWWYISESHGHDCYWCGQSCQLTLCSSSHWYTESRGHLIRSFNITSSRLCIGIGRFLINIWYMTRWHSRCSALLSAPVSSLSQLYPSGNTYFGLQIFTAYLILQFVINNIWYIVYIVYSIDRVESKKNIAIITLEESVLKC